MDRPDQKRTAAEKGIILILFAISLPVLIALLVLVIDAGSLYLARLRMTKIARSASATALNIIALRGWGSMVADSTPSEPGALNLGLKTANVALSPPSATAANQTLLSELDAAVKTALASYYPGDFPNGSATGETTYLRYLGADNSVSASPQLTILNMQDSSVSFGLRYAVRTYLLGVLSQIFGGISSTSCEKLNQERFYRCWVNNSPTSGLNTGEMTSANVLMLLDTSGSMAEEINGKAKSTALIEAAATFIDMFNPVKDRFAVIPYATSADTGSAPVLSSLSQQTGSGVADYLPVKNEVAALEVGGQTDPCDALIQVIRAVQSDAVLQDPKTAKFVLLFTDGAPNVYRLSFCEGSDCQTVPSKLQEALNQSTLPASANDNGWYGWTTFWDKRMVFRRRSPFDACPGGELENAPQGSTTIPECDPVWSFPRVSKGSGQEATYAEVSNYLRLNENGEFYFNGGTYNGSTLNQLGFSLIFRELPSDGPRAYQLSDAFRWFGPSYLVHSSFQVPRGASLIDRIPTSLESSLGQTAVTCGPGSRQPFPGYQTKSSPFVADKYAHSRYFASRVLDSDWRWNGDTESDSTQKAERNGLTSAHLSTAPSYFAQAHTLDTDPTDSPGCLSTLQAKLPFTDALVNVGSSFVSNQVESIRDHGEAVKSAELPYYCAVRAADWLRKNYNFVVFVVGLGPSATSIYGDSCEDPLQNALDPNSRKDRFLTRLAFAANSLSDPADFLRGNSSGIWNSKNDLRFRRSVTLNSCTDHPLTGVSIETGFSEIAIGDGETGPIGFTPADLNLKPEHLGAYFGASDPDELKPIFAEIAKRMLLKLSL
jgi:hypothetical protein